MKRCSLTELSANARGEIISLGNSPAMRRRLQDLGFTKGAAVTPLFSNSSLRAYLIKEAVIALRAEDASLIDVIWRNE